MKTLALTTLALALAACTPEPQTFMPNIPPNPPPPAASSAPPPAADQAPVTDGDVTSFTVNGMLVVVKRVHGAELATINLYVRGGVRNWTADNAGIEELAFSTAASGGSEKLGRDALSRKLASLGSELSGFSTADYGGFEASALQAQFDETFGLLADAFLTPAFPAEEVELKKRFMISGLRHEQENPDGQLQLLIHQSVYKGHPYENRSVGTMESVPKLTADAARAHLAKLRETSRLMLIVAGDVEPAHVSDLATSRFGTLQRGSYQESSLPAISFMASKVTVTPAKLPTNYIQGDFGVPVRSSPDYPAAVVAMTLLHHRVFEEVRTKRNLSYAPSASLGGPSMVPFGDLYVTATDPNTTIKVMYDEVKRMQNEPVSEHDLAGAKSSWLTGMTSRKETTGGQAGSLAAAQIYAGDFRFDKAIFDKVKAVTAKDVQAFTKKYIGHLQVFVIGDPAKVDQQLFGSL